MSEKGPGPFRRERIEGTIDDSLQKRLEDVCRG